MHIECFTALAIHVASSPSSKIDSIHIVQENKMVNHHPGEKNNNDNNNNNKGQGHNNNKLKQNDDTGGADKDQRKVKFPSRICKGDHFQH